jgi:hypothetical protein
LHVRARETPTYIWAAVAILGVALIAVPVLAVAPTPGAEASPSAVASSSAEPSATSSTQPSASSSAEPSPSAAPSPSPAADPSPGEPSPGQPSQSVAPAASPAPSPAASASPEPFGPPIPQPDAGVEPGKPDKADKADRQKVPEVPVTLTGSVGSTTDADGETVFTLTSGGQTFELEAGPLWWWGADHPLAPFVGRTVTVSGETRTGSGEIDVQAIGGTTIRESGKPPWAGGPWKIGERHPGWKPWKVLGEDGRPGLGQGHGREHAPGQVKKLADQAAPAPSAGPD